MVSFACELTDSLLIFEDFNEPVDLAFILGFLTSEVEAATSAVE
jgi:hypothetical protein